MELPVGINVHLVFYKSLLEKAPPRAKLAPIIIHEETQDPIYDVEELVGFRLGIKIK